MNFSSLKEVIFWILLGGLLLVAACASPEPWWQGKPISEMTPAEREEQDPTFWFFWATEHGLGK
jgi:ABC-type glycerol-3-phosphate transport system substrate-binding protein